MSYIERNLLPDEQILFRTKKHLILFAIPAILTILSIFVFNYMHSNFILVKFEWVPSVILLILWASVGLEYYFSEFAVTNKRVMMREGFFFRHTNEMRIRTISQVNVYQSLLGQMLDYGSVSINAFGVSDAYPMIASPFTFQRYVNEQLDKITM
ncbi:MAG: PH domain-containing protein [Gammaproteobacteria bacterium]|nr:PH domain-containing protein [Gammaproteobacteria bacterium]MCW5583405.1 PH domain-containing protein [Gammaproteobacteria bacterium]